jgi:hypothetical protein
VFAYGFIYYQGDNGDNITDYKSVEKFQIKNTPSQSVTENIGNSQYSAHAPGSNNPEFFVVLTQCF